MEQIIKAVGRITLSGISALAVLSMFCLIYSYGKLHIEQPSGATDFTAEPYCFSSNMQEGFSWNVMDGNGYNNPSIFETVDVLMMGASHMESGAQQKNMTSLLNTEYLPEYHSYSIARAGHLIYTNVKNLRSACRQFQPTKYIVMDIHNTELDYNSMKLVVEDDYPIVEESISDPIKKFIVNYIPATANIRVGLKNWYHKNSETEDEIMDIGITDYRTMLDEFLEYAKNIMGGVRG